MENLPLLGSNLHIIWLCLSWMVKSKSIALSIHISVHKKSLSWKIFRPAPSYPPPSLVNNGQLLAPLYCQVQCGIEGKAEMRKDSCRLQLLQRIGNESPGVRRPRVGKYPVSVWRQITQQALQTQSMGEEWPNGFRRAALSLNARLLIASENIQLRERNISKQCPSPKLESCCFCVKEQT